MQVGGTLLKGCIDKRQKICDYSCLWSMTYIQHCWQKDSVHLGTHLPHTRARTRTHWFDYRVSSNHLLLVLNVQCTPCRPLTFAILFSEHMLLTLVLRACKLSSCIELLRLCGETFSFVLSKAGLSMHCVDPSNVAIFDDNNECPLHFRWSGRSKNAWKVPEWEWC